MAPIGELCKRAGEYLNPDQVTAIYNAYLLGADAHREQTRASGDPYITHPLEVAALLVDLRLDSESIVAAVLHDVLEDTAVSKEHIERDFGGEVAELVDGVTKLSRLEATSRDVAQAENYRKMLLAMTNDVRVMLVKLADRLHNMRTIDALSPDKQRRIARETLEIYAPIANRLGLNKIREELEDLGFQALYPKRYEVLQKELRRTRGGRRRIVQQVRKAIARRLRLENLEGKVIGREKFVYSVYRKMRTKHLPLHEVLDVCGIRIIVPDVDACYRALGCVHNLYKPRPGRFKDYIAIPKANGYQSLHTVLFGPHSIPLEVQIRSEEMHEVAESGIAAHALYKSKDREDGAEDNTAHRRARTWVRELLEMQKAAGDPVEFIEHVKVDLFPETVFVFTPAGEIMELARGATPVDFAYAIHSDIGNTCQEARIDGHRASLRTPLQTGQTVEIITDRNARPDPSWLNFAITGRAQAHIRNHLKHLQHDEAVALGRRMLERALRREGLSFRKLRKDGEARVLEELRCEDRDALCAEVGLGRRRALLVAKQLAAAQGGELLNGTEGAAVAPLFITGTEGMALNLGRCCRPIPGDRIVGYMSSGRGLVVHAGGCSNLSNMSVPAFIDLDWSPDIERHFPVDIRVDVEDQKGVLATVAAAISELDVNIASVEVGESDTVVIALMFTIEVSGRTHLAEIFRRLRRIPAVRHIVRRAEKPRTRAEVRAAEQATARRRAAAAAADA